MSKVTSEADGRIHKIMSMDPIRIEGDPSDYDNSSAMDVQSKRVSEMAQANH